MFYENIDKAMNDCDNAVHGKNNESNNNTTNINKKEELPMVYNVIYSISLYDLLTI